MELLLQHGAAPLLWPQDAAFLLRTQVSHQMLARMLLAPGRFGRQQPRRDLIFESEQFATSMQVAVAAGHESRVRLLLESAERASTEVGDAPISECCPKPKVNRRPSWSGQEDENNKMIQVQFRHGNSVFRASTSCVSHKSCDLQV